MISLRYRWLALLLCAFVPAFAAAEGAEDILRTETPAYDFAPSDQKLLDEVQRGCFNFLWNECGHPSGMVQDRRTNMLASMAGVGFQLSAIPIGVERGWITRDEGQRRALGILRLLAANGNNRHDGVLAHFLDSDTGKISQLNRGNEASTVDHALFLAGAIPAAVYFGGEVATIVDRLATETNWRSYLDPHGVYLKMGWLPADNATMSGPGKLIDASWHLASDEERLIYFLAAGAPNPAFAVDPAVYYRLERHVKEGPNGSPYVVSWNGALFTYFFSHCWIDYRGFGADDPAAFGVEGPRVDWFENSRRAALSHRQRCLDASGLFKSFGPDRWGVSPCMGFNDKGNLDYLVQDVQPNLSNVDNWQFGNVAPYAAGCSIMFTPRESMAALRAFRELKDADGDPLAWSDPAKGGYGFCDSFNLDQMRSANDYVSIDAGPLILGIENARTGLIWRLFGKHELAKRAAARLKFVEAK